MAFLVAWAGLFACYLVLAGAPSWTETAAAVPVAALAAVFLVQIDRLHARHLTIGHAPWLRLLAASLGNLLPDSIRVGRVLLRAIRTRPPLQATPTLQRQPFRHGSDTPAEAGRRALVTLAVSFAPNAYVAEIPDGPLHADTLLVHRLQPAAASPDRDWPL